VNAITFEEDVLALEENIKKNPYFLFIIIESTVQQMVHKGSWN